MSVGPAENMATLSSDLFYDILKRLDGATLASASCACAAFSSMSKEERLWENVCSSMWPSTQRDDVKKLVSQIGGFKKFYADCFPLIVNKNVSEFTWSDYPEYPEELTEAEYYGDFDEFQNVSPSDFVSIVDIRYKDRTICSKVIWGIPNANGFNGWFSNCPFRIDLFSFSGGGDDHTGGVTLSIADGLPLVTSMERERKDGKLWQELRDGIRYKGIEDSGGDVCVKCKKCALGHHENPLYTFYLNLSFYRNRTIYVLSWIVVNTKTKKAANLSSWSPLGGQRHWPTEKDFLLRFGSILPAKGIIPCQMVECILAMKFQVTEASVVQTTLKLTELCMQLGDMEGAHVNGRNSLLVLNEALSCDRSKNYNLALESCHLYSKVQSEIKEEKMRYENRLDKLWILGGITVFATLFCYFM